MGARRHPAASVLTAPVAGRELKAHAGGGNQIPVLIVPHDIVTVESAAAAAAAAAVMVAQPVPSPLLGPRDGGRGTPLQAPRDGRDEHGLWAPPPTAAGTAGGAGRWRRRHRLDQRVLLDHRHEGDGGGGVTGRSAAAVDDVSAAPMLVTTAVKSVGLAAAAATAAGTPTGGLDGCLVPLPSLSSTPPLWLPPPLPWLLPPPPSPAGAVPANAAALFAPLPFNAMAALASHPLRGWLRFLSRGDDDTEAALSSLLRAALAASMLVVGG